MLQYRNMVCNTFMPRNHVCCLSPLHPPPQITVSDKGIWRLRHNVNKSSLSLILFAMMLFQTEIVGPVGLFSMNLIMVFETQFITIWSSNWWGWIKSIRSLKPYTETGPHGAPTWSSLWKKNPLMLLQGLEFPRECPSPGSQACRSSSLSVQLYRTLPYIKGNNCIHIISAHWQCWLK